MLFLFSARCKCEKQTLNRLFTYLFSQNPFVELVSCNLQEGNLSFDLLFTSCKEQNQSLDLFPASCKMKICSMNWLFTSCREQNQSLDLSFTTCRNEIFEWNGHLQLAGTKSIVGFVIYNLQERNS